MIRQLRYDGRGLFEYKATLGVFKAGSKSGRTALYNYIVDGLSAIRLATEAEIEKQRTTEANTDGGVLYWLGDAFRLSPFYDLYIASGAVFTFTSGTGPIQKLKVRENWAGGSLELLSHLPPELEVSDLGLTARGPDVETFKSDLEILLSMTPQEQRISPSLLASTAQTSTTAKNPS